MADGRAGFAANDSVQNSPPLDTFVGGEDEVDINATQDEVGEDHISTRKRCNSDIGISSRHTTKRQSVREAMVENVGRMADALDTWINWLTLKIQMQLLE